MAKITLPVASVQTGGNLVEWFRNLISVNNELKRSRMNGTVVISDDNASQDQKIVLTQQEIIDILTEAGDVEEYLCGIRAPNTVAAVNVPVGLPIRTFILGAVKNFAQWFLPGSEVWTEDGGNEFIFYTNPLGSAGSVSDYLKASQMEIIRQINTSGITFLTTEEVQAVVASGWTKV